MREGHRAAEVKSQFEPIGLKGESSLKLIYTDDLKAYKHICPAEFSLGGTNGQSLFSEAVAAALCDCYSRVVSDKNSQLADGDFHHLGRFSYLFNGWHWWGVVFNIFHQPTGQYLINLLEMWSQCARWPWMQFC